MNILVTAISGDVGNSILKCLAGSGNHVFGCDVNDYPVGLDRVEVFYQVPYAVEKNYLDTLLNICAKENISYLLPANETEIEYIDRHRTLFGEHGISLLINNSRLLQVCLDKYATAQVLQDQGIDTPETFLVDEYRPDGKPYIVKLRHSCGSKLLEKVTTMGQVLELEQQTGEPLVIQGWISPEEGEYTVGVFRWDGIIRSIIFRRELRNGYTQFVDLVQDEEITRLANQAAVALDLRGCMNIQLRKYDGRNYVFEINPRVSGTSYFRHQLGFTDVLWWLKCMAGAPLEPYQAAYKKAIGIRELNEKILVKEPW